MATISRNLRVCGQCVGGGCDQGELVGVGQSKHLQCQRAGQVKLFAGQAGGQLEGCAGGPGGDRA